MQFQTEADRPGEFPLYSPFSRNNSPHAAFPIWCAKLTQRRDAIFLSRGNINGTITRVNCSHRLRGELLRRAYVFASAYTRGRKLIKTFECRALRTECPVRNPLIWERGSHNRWHSTYSQQFTSDESLIAETISCRYLSLNHRPQVIAPETLIIPDVPGLWRTGDDICCPPKFMAELRLRRIAQGPVSFLASSPRERNRRDLIIFCSVAAGGITPQTVTLLWFDSDLLAKLLNFLRNLITSAIFESTGSFVLRTG